jgi:hypothetical protein
MLVVVVVDITAVALEPQVVVVLAEMVARQIMLQQPQQ